MSNSLQFTQTFDGSNWSADITVTSGSTLPTAIFVYLNTGTDQLGEYVTTCSFDELQRFQIWQGTPIPVFGNKYVRHDRAKITRSSLAELQTTVAILTAAVKQLVAEIGANPSTTTVIPIS